MFKTAPKQREYSLLYWECLFLPVAIESAENVSDRNRKYMYMYIYTTLPYPIWRSNTKKLKETAVTMVYEGALASVKAHHIIANWKLGANN